MRLSNVCTVTMFASVALASCAFDPAPADGTNGSPGSGGRSIIVTGTGGRTVTGTGGGVVTGTGGSSSCGQTNVAIQALPPDVLIIQDKSGSMDDDSSGNSCNTMGCTKWEQVSAAVISVVMSTQSRVNWGLKFFGNNSQCGVNAGVAVGVAPNNYTPIQRAFGNTSPGGYTPTATAVNSGADYLGTLTDPNPKFILLATDGLPNCAPGQSSTADDSSGARQAVTRAFNMGFPTFVVGIATSSDPMATTTLNQMAVNGGYPQTGAATQYYSVSDTASLEAALGKIVGIVASSCTLPLNGAPSNFDNVAVSVQTANGAIAVPRDTSHVNGWDYINNKTAVQFYGPACDSLKSGTYNGVQFIYACPGTTIIVG